MSEPLLGVRGLKAGYGGGRVLFGVDLDLDAGEVVTLLGKNGMGRTTFLKALLGLIGAEADRLRFAGQDLIGLPPFERARLGIGWVPEGRRVFAGLSVEENLLATARTGPWDLKRVHALFPRLKERRRQDGRTLSGGEAQMLSIGRALMTAPKLLLLDEATEGLAPMIAGEIWACVAAVKAEGVAVLLVDKHLDPLLPLADRHCVVEKGRIVWQGARNDLVAKRAEVERLIGL